MSDKDKDDINLDNSVVPEYVRLNISPKEGGGSLLHDSVTGIPKANSSIKKDNIPVMKEISAEPVVIKASDVKDENEEKSFIPPKSNFVSVGNQDHAWYPESVTGSSEFIDNNDFVDVEALQGLDPLAEDLPSEDPKKFSKEAFVINNKLKKLDYNIRSLVNNASSVDALIKIKSNLFSQSILEFKRSFQKITDGDEKKIISNRIKETFGILDGLLNEAIESISKNDINTNSGNEVEVTSIDEDQYIIFVDDNPVCICNNKTNVKNVLNDLLLKEDVNISRVKLIKRIPIDFGVLVSE